MENSNLNQETVDVIENLQKEINSLKHLKSNVEVVWKLEWMANNKLIQHSANSIKNSLIDKHGVIE